MLFIAGLRCHRLAPSTARRDPEMRSHRPISSLNMLACTWPCCVTVRWTAVNKSTMKHEEKRDKVVNISTVSASSKAHNMKIEKQPNHNAYRPISSLNMRTCTCP